MIELTFTEAVQLAAKDMAWYNMTVEDIRRTLKEQRESDTYQADHDFTCKQLRR